MNQIKIQEVFQEQCWLCGKWLPKDEIKEHQSQCSNHFSKEDQEAYDERIAMFFDQNKSSIFQTKKNLQIEDSQVEQKIGRMKIIEEKSQMNQFQKNLVETNLKRNDDSNNPQKPSQANVINNQREEQQQFIQQNEQQLKNVIRSSQNHSNSPARSELTIKNNANYFPIQEKKPFAGYYESQLISRKPLLPQQESDQRQQFKSEFIQKKPQVNQAQQHQQIQQPNTFLNKPQIVNEIKIEEEAPQLVQKLPQVAYENDSPAFKYWKQKEKQKNENEIKQYKQQNRDFQQQHKFSHPYYYKRDQQNPRHNQPQVEKNEPQQQLVNNEVQNELILLQPPRLQQQPQPQPQQQQQQQQQVQQQPRKSYQPQSKPGERNINTANEQRRQYQYIPNQFRNEDRKRNLSDHQQHAPFKYQPGMKLTDAQVNKLTPEQLYEYFTSLDLENQVGYQSRIFNLQNKAAQIKKTETCSVCMEDILPSKEIHDVKLDCNHCFHYACIEQWLKLQKNCPVCKAKVVL